MLYCFYFFVLNKQAPQAYLACKVTNNILYYNAILTFL